MSTISVTLGVSFAKNGIFTAARTHLQISLTNSGFCPHAKPIPRSPIPCGQLKFNSNAWAPAASDRFANSVQSASSYEHIILAINTYHRKVSFTDSHKSCRSLSHVHDE
ncbi:hypothetical protein BV898_07837 [Hypsibius exemplaris]|uniref:Uncharacterized protein n=1 Tax=Hypsibius exemplaris TaxID=2072580 RepID=A0A1W0WS89_HYPEX|nr:hypothetical protein BV898_07837 [Hypsibius exemplaris]